MIESDATVSNWTPSLCCSSWYIAGTLRCPFTCTFQADSYHLDLLKKNQLVEKANEKMSDWYCLLLLSVLQKPTTCGRFELQMSRGFMMNTLWCDSLKRGIVENVTSSNYYFFRGNAKLTCWEKCGEGRGQKEPAVFLWYDWFEMFPCEK